MKSEEQIKSRIYNLRVQRNELNTKYSSLVGTKRDTTEIKTQIVVLEARISELEMVLDQY